jgi:hypothetical protein
MESREKNEVVVARCQETAGTGRRRRKSGTVARRRWEPGMGNACGGRVRGDEFFQVKKRRGVFAK